ncbi:unnamed protein product, partial [Ectocarpus sp. 12 AP-2014]
AATWSRKREAGCAPPAAHLHPARVAVAAAFSAAATARARRRDVGRGVRRAPQEASVGGPPRPGGGVSRRDGAPRERCVHAAIDPELRERALVPFRRGRYRGRR